MGFRSIRNPSCYVGQEGIEAIESERWSSLRLVVLCIIYTTLSSTRDSGSVVLKNNKNVLYHFYSMSGGVDWKTASFGSHTFYGVESLLRSLSHLSPEL